MAKKSISHGPVSIEIPDDLALDARAGKLDEREVSLIAKAPKGIGLVSDMTANAMEQAGAAFVAPPDVKPADLRRLGNRAEAYDTFLNAIDVVRKTLAQGNVLADADAWEALRKVNDMVKGQVKHKPELKQMFEPLSAFMARGKTGGKSGGSSAT